MRFQHVLYQAILKGLASSSLLFFSLFGVVYMSSEDSASFWRLFSTAQLIAFLSRYALDASLIIDPLFSKHKSTEYVLAGYCLLLIFSIPGSIAFSIFSNLQGNSVFLGAIVVFLNTIMYLSFVLRRYDKHILAVLFDPNISFFFMIAAIAVGGIPSITLLTIFLGLFALFAHFVIHIILKPTLIIPNRDIFSSFFKNSHHHFKISSSNYLVNQGSSVLLNWALPVHGVADFNFLLKLWSTMRLLTVMFNSTMSKKVSTIYSNCGDNFDKLSEFISFKHRYFFRLFVFVASVIVSAVIIANFTYNLLDGFLAMFLLGTMNELLVARTGMASNITILGRLTFHINFINYAALLIFAACVFIASENSSFLILIYILKSITRNLSFTILCSRKFSISFFKGNKF